MTIRTDVVALITGLDMSRGGQITWTHDDGRALTDTERELVNSATKEELEAARAYADRAVDFHADKLADFERLEQITRPYLAGLPNGAPMSDVVASMNEADRTAFLGIMERLAPDGTLAVACGPIARTVARFIPYVTVDHDDEYGDPLTAAQIERQIEQLRSAEVDAGDVTLSSQMPFLREEDSEHILGPSGGVDGATRSELEGALAYAAAEVIALNRELAQVTERGIALVRLLAQQNPQN